MKTWKLLLKFPDDTTKSLDLYDSSEFFNGYLKIKRTYFTSMIKAIKMTKKYSTGNGIERVTSPEGEDWTFNPWILLFVEENENGNPFWLLIKREMDLSGSLIGVGPKPFVDYNIANTSGAKRDIKRLINYIITHFNKFSCIVLLPNYLL